MLGAVFATASNEMNFLQIPPNLSGEKILQKTGDQVLNIYLEKLQYFESELAKISDKSMQFNLKKEIEEVRAEINKRSKPSIHYDPIIYQRIGSDSNIGKLMQLEDIELANKIFKRFSTKEINDLYLEVLGKNMDFWGGIASNSHRIVFLVAEAKKLNKLEKLAEVIFTLEPDFLQI